MLHKTKGIVISYVKYRESSIITKVYTEAFGLQTYIVNSVRSTKGRGKIALFQPLTLLDMVVYHKHQNDINRLSEVKCLYPFKSIPFEIKKSSISIFIAEVIGKTIREEEENVPLFQFLEKALKTLDALEAHYTVFHLQFMLKLASFLGFEPFSARIIFDELTTYHPIDTTENEALINTMIRAGYGEVPNVNNNSKRDILEIIIQFYRLHIENFGTLRSVQVLNEVLKV